MLVLTIPPVEHFDESNSTFTKIGKETTVRLEHSLLSISKWEAEFKKPFLPAIGVAEKTREEANAYIKCMVIGPISDVILEVLSLKYEQTIVDYIEDPMTATTFQRSGDFAPRPKKVVTSEEIYYWMMEFGIYKECERWHLNRLLTLIDIFRIKRTNGGGKQSRKSALNQRRSLMAQRRAAMRNK